MSDSIRHQFLPAESRGFCWSVGHTRLGLECRIWPMAQNKKTPVIIESSATLSEAIRRAIENLGNQTPQ